MQNEEFSSLNNRAIHKSLSLKSLGKAKPQIKSTLESEEPNLKLKVITKALIPAYFPVYRG